MSSRPEAGKEDARDEVQDDGLDLQHDVEIGEEELGASHDYPLEVDLVADAISHEDGLPEAGEHDISQQNAESGILHSSQGWKTQITSTQPMEDTHSADGTSSVPDDTPSVQVISSLPIG